MGKAITARVHTYVPYVLHLNKNRQIKRSQTGLVSHDVYTYSYEDVLYLSFYSSSVPADMHTSAVKPGQSNESRSVILKHSQAPGTY